MANADFLKERAEGFLENARENVKAGRYYLAAFNFEQALQLYSKYYLFLKLVDFPKTQEIEKLLRGIGKVYEKEKEVDKMLLENFQVVADLEEAYISSRYLPSEFSKLQVGAMEKFTNEVLEFLHSL